MSNYSFFSRADNSMSAIDALGQGNRPPDTKADEYRALYAALRQEMKMSDKQLESSHLSDAAHATLDRMVKQFGTVPQRVRVTD